jgi:hypothetical protein
MLRQSFLLVILCGSVILFAADNSWSKSGRHYSYTRTGKITAESCENGGIKYTFSVGSPEYPFDAATGDCDPGTLTYNGNATSGAASIVTGTALYSEDELPESDLNMAMWGSLLPPYGEDGSRPTWSASATLRSPFWLTPITSTVAAGTPVTISAHGNPTQSTWMIDSSAWKNGTANPVAVSSVTLNRNMWDKMGWTPDDPPEDYLAPSAGTYIVSATTTETEDPRSANAVVHVVDVEFVSPSGDPVEKPSTSNEFVFSNAATGVLTLTLSARVKPASAIDLVKDNAVFTVGDITGSVKAWHNDNPNGKAKVNGDLLTATVTFTGMPTENGSFGTKTARITCSGGGLSFDKTTEYEVFYNATATNHPTCASCANCPNWFYYYKKASGGGSYTYGAGLLTSQSSSAGGDGSIKLADNVYSGGQYITTIINSTGRLNATGWSGINKYYPHFCGVLAHERQHANGEQSPPGGTTDRDSDWLTNAFETSNSKTNPDDKYSARILTMSDAFSDDEVYAGGPVEQAGIAGANSSLDWAYPGSNSKQP